MSCSLHLLMRFIRLSVLFLFVFCITASPVVLAATPGQAPAGARTVYLPTVMNDYTPPPPLGSLDLIDAAQQQGQISAETALEYKTFAVFGDPRLPAAYQAGTVGSEGDLFMLEAAGAYPSLSAQAKAILSPFFTPPFMAGSWAAQGMQSQGITAPSDWAYLSAAGGKARVWYKKANPTMQAKAGVVANALTSIVWTKETDLMGQSPIPDSAGVQNFVVDNRYRNGWNSAFVPFGGYAGMTVPKSCSQTPAIIYINPSLPDTGNSATIGIVETTAHEFMHALQFSFPLAVNPCVEYRWMGEATATWAEDFVYPDHNTEWRMANSYLTTPQLRLDDTTQWRQYGEYMLVYFFTKKYDDPDAVRRAWVTAGYQDSFMSFNSLGGLNYDQVASLWNEAPFGTFFRDQDKLDYGVSASADDTLKATGGFKVYDLKDTLKTGGIHFFHYKVDPSVHTITFLNGLTSKITAEPYNGLADDTVYNQGDVTPEESKGAEAVVLVKYAGRDQPDIMPYLGRLDICQDWLNQKVDEILIAIANNDLSDRNHEIQPTGESTKILVSSVPCLRITGSASVTTTYAGVTDTLNASGLVYEDYAFDPSWDYRVSLFGADDINMELISGSWSWSINGVDATGCSHSGSGSGSINKDTNGSQLTLYYDLLPGSKRYLAYEGTGGPDWNTEVTDKVSCPHQTPYDDTNTLWDFFMPEGTVPVGADGALTGTKTYVQGDITTTYHWNFQPSPE